MEQLIRFDWAIKKLLRDKANFDILEGFLSAMLHEDVTVVNLLESESNQEDETDKLNRVDLLVENATHDLILIEVQVKSEQDYFHRIAYGAAKLLTEYLAKGQAYKHLKKVISVSITYFNLGVGKDYLYYGSTQFLGVHKQDTLLLTRAQQKLFGFPTVNKIFPEYYVIRVGKFSDEIHEAIDEWIYMLKHNEIKPEFTAKNIQTASEKLRVMNLDEAQRKAYDQFLNNQSYQSSMLWSSREEGKREGKEDTARTMLADGVSVEQIMKYTGLRRDEVDQLREKDSQAL